MDFLRLILAIWVMLAHLAIWSGLVDQHIPDAILWITKRLGMLFQPTGETHPAVIGFIVLSGYCIHRNGARRENFSIVSYGTRRAFRIVPTYLLASIVGAIGFIYLTTINHNLAKIITGTQQISLDGLIIKLSGISAFIPKLHNIGFQGNAPLTTVMVEIWLYVFYAIVMRRLTLGMQEQTFWKTFFGLWCSGIIIICDKSEYYPWWNNGSLIAFLPYWWLGVIAVNKLENWTLLKNWKLMILFYLLFTLLITPEVLNGIVLFLIVEFRKITLAVLFAHLIISIDGVHGQIIELGAKIGRASYSIYAYHAPILAIFLLSAFPWWIVAWLVLAIATGIYIFFEAPLTIIGKKLATELRK